MGIKERKILSYTSWIQAMQFKTKQGKEKLSSAFNSPEFVAEWKYE